MNTVYLKIDVLEDEVSEHSEKDFDSRQASSNREHSGLGHHNDGKLDPRGVVH